MNDVRLSIVLVLVLVTGFISHGVNARGGRGAAADGAAPPPPRTTITAVPGDVGRWHGADAGPLDTETLQAIGADRILNRTYVAPAASPIGLYVAAYDRQRPSVSIHSPLHCLPGTGWSVLSDDTRRVADVGGHHGAVRRLVAVRDRARVVILYWYAIHGRLVASDAMSRAYLLADSLRTGRNDAALVRLVIPVTAASAQPAGPWLDSAPGEDAADAEAEAHGLEFMRALLPFVSGSL